MLSSGSAIGDGAFWLSEDDATAANEFLTSIAGDSSPWQRQPRGLWQGYLDIPYVDPELGDRDVGTVTIEARSFRVSIEPTGVDRAPAILGMMVIGESRLGDAIGSRIVRIVGLDQVPPILLDKGVGSVLPRTDSPAIRLASLAVVERLAREVEDAAQTPNDVAIARIVLESIAILRVYALDGGDPDLANALADSLLRLAKWMVRTAAGGAMAKLGAAILGAIAGSE